MSSVLTGQHTVLREHLVQHGATRPRGESVRQDLERDIAIQFRVAGTVYLTHPASADRRGDFVDAEAGAGGEGQT
jgi:hypothetical protein